MTGINMFPKELALSLLLMILSVNGKPDIITLFVHSCMHFLFSCTLAFSSLFSCFSSSLLIQLKRLNAIVTSSIPPAALERIARGESAARPQENNYALPRGREVR